MSLGIGGHESPVMKNDEWLTPPELFHDLGPFDLDPCAPIKRPWDTAAKHYTREDNGLWKPWSGRVWLNPPYGRDTATWVRRLAQHGNGIALIFARTETAIWFPWVWDYADALLFLRGRLHFHYVDGRRAEGNAGAPSVLVAYGAINAKALRDANILGNLGKYLELARPDDD